MGELEQTLPGGPTRLRFLGAHLFDLLDKLEHEVRPIELERRRVICAALESVAASGAPVVRLWGSLKHTGNSLEVERSAELLALVLNENARRARPLRFVVTLQNHQPGYGSPKPEASLDDQDPESPWNARRIYLEGSWRTPSQGLLAERIDTFRRRPDLATSPYVLAWELVNELDTHRILPRGQWQGAAADALRSSFLVPALTSLAGAFTQPIMLGDLRGSKDGHGAFARSVVDALPPEVRGRLVWTSHVYAPLAASARAPEVQAALGKLDLDLDVAADTGLPFLLGEVGQWSRGAPAGFCRDGATHDVEQLFAAVLEPSARSPRRGAIEAALFWGEGRCDLGVESARGPLRITIGAGGDSADLGPGDSTARTAVRTAREQPRFRSE